MILPLYTFLPQLFHFYPNDTTIISFSMIISISVYPNDITTIIHLYPSDISIISISLQIILPLNIIWGIFWAKKTPDLDPNQDNQGLSAENIS